MTVIIHNNISGATEGFWGAGWRSQWWYLKWHLVHRTRRALVIHTLRARCRADALNALLEQGSGARARFAKNRRASTLCEK